MTTRRLVDERDKLAELETLLLELLDCLKSERDAVAKLASEKLQDIAQDKLALATRIHELRILVGAGDRASNDQSRDQSVRPTDAEIDGTRSRIRELAHKVAGESRANRALLADATDMVSGMLGVERDTGTYDQRARRRTRTRRFLKGAA